ncbi:TetR/AcrR family transcriptional regulator C-terminal domain-containing protein [Nocardia crassostreae]|uniref:TetR/AcrR family transcriptional regulator C-terminal domain-containing protein n=1 Tax=Nocardia crassostreae TaxID=53428 RepID=UPI0008302005|nr:TetR/AcrR family transcriptional regulator C-terminal domain-containing protein [Nocardia crassostreae]
MTNKQPARTARVGLAQESVVEAALVILNEKGRDAVSMRAIADRLGVRMNTVLWHAKTKNRLLELMADAILGATDTSDLPDPWDERVRELMRRARRSMLAYRDGAAVVAGTYTPEPGTLHFADTLVAALLEGGLEPKRASWTCWTIVYFVLGLVQEEQGYPLADTERMADRLVSGAYPALIRAGFDMSDDSFDDRLEFGLDLILASLRR